MSGLEVLTALRGGALGAAHFLQKENEFPALPAVPGAFANLVPARHETF